jgi:sigma-B regulation protein RsbU (phosphoserine phosphatase)
MAKDKLSLDDLWTVNHIAETLNRSVDVRSALQTALKQLVELMGLETGWIFICDESKQNRFAGRGFDLIAHHHLPPGLALNVREVWHSGCDCQTLCTKGKLTQAYNEVRCSRLAAARGSTAGLTTHASVPLRSGESIVGILNVASDKWEEFTPRSLALLTNVGNMMGVALERARLYDMLQERRVDEQSVLLDLSAQMLGKPNLREMMQFVVNEVQHLLEIDACALLLHEEQTDRLRFRAASGWKFDPVTLDRWLIRDDRSISGQVMNSQQPLVVEDISFYSHLSDWVEAEEFRGHGVVPLIVNGRSIGVLMVNSRKPRLLRDDEIRLLQLLGNHAAIALDKARLYEEHHKRKRLEEELDVSRHIQLSMLPEACPKVPGWQFCAIYEAAKQVGGDFYDFFRIPKEPYMMGIVIADVADKGVPAALVMALSRTIIRSASMRIGRSARESLLRANELMLNDSRSNMFLSAFYAKLDTETGWMTYCNAGHNPPLWYRSELGEFQPLTTQGIVLGIFEDIELEEQTISLSTDDIVVFYTDGVTEAMNKAGEEFGMERFKQVIAEHADYTADIIEQAVVDAVRDFIAGSPQSDDFTMVVIKREPAH